MDSESKQRISLYLDRALVKKTDKLMKEYGFASRNEFYAKASENFIADELLHDNKSIVGEKLAVAVSELSEENARAISKGLFRYAVQLEMVMRIMAEQFDYDKDSIEAMRREAINNVRRTRGKVHLEDILSGRYNEE
ncbi:MAG: hypothetical protein RR177_06800 [Oscillospiraceae bacterium]